MRYDCVLVIKDGKVIALQLLNVVGEMYEVIRRSHFSERAKRMMDQEATQGSHCLSK